MNLTSKISILTEKVIQKLYEYSEHNYNISPDTVNTKYVYHCARNSNSENEGYKAIFNFGFERYFVNKGVGNLYGPGVYTTIDLASSIINAKKGIYGNVIIKAEILNYDKFLIWHPILSKKVYGDKWRLKDQFNILFPKEANQLKIENPAAYKKLTEPDELRTGPLAHQFWVLCSRGFLSNAYDKIHGLAFIGSNDGHVAVVKDVKNLIPIEYSLDYGKTWNKGVTDKTLKYTKHDFDVAYHFGKKYDKTTPPEFGYAKVEKNGKVNYVNKEGEKISTNWFDGGGNFTETIDGHPIAQVIYSGYSLFLSKDGQIYQDLDDEYPLCHANELQEYV